ncbi:MAG: prolipoprotein diacylglyceryl transferase [Chloroflexota bacterium]
MLTFYQNLLAPPRHLIPVLLTMWIGLNISESLARKRGQPAEKLSNLVFYAVVAWLVGGRLAFAALHPQAFIASPLSLFYPNTDIFDLAGAWVAALATALIYARKHSLLSWETLDFLVPFFAFTTLGLALAHLAEGKIFGIETSVPWAVEQLEARRHPYLIYELLAASGTLGLLWPRWTRSTPVAGSGFFLFAALTSGWMLFIEAFRGDSTFIFGGLRLAQVGALAVLAISLYLLDARFKARPAITS